MDKKRCAWVNLNNPLYVIYHDREWGRIPHSERVYFEFLVLESAQAGLSWELILNRREAYRIAYANFDPVKVSLFTSSDVDRLLTSEGIVKHEGKIIASILLAKIFLEIQSEYRSFQLFMNAMQNNMQTPIRDKGTQERLSRNISNEIKKRGGLYFGPTIARSYLEAIGVFDNHEPNCFLSNE